ncbi:UBA-like domain-containing protein 2 [Lolium rigidum]|uniref:UBA-like domain-containing protein 2 n=1 Tax=Lolium rigidum TaxID=89674 RepID=UPI001F5CF1B2|nr:UBA-like domain-containing protein 2 [Lolium rigidum]
MAPPARPPRRPATLTLLLPLLLLSSPSLSLPAAADSPPSTPAPRHAQVASDAADQLPAPPRHGGHHHHHHHHRHPPPPPPKRRLNFGERLGIAFAGVAAAMQLLLAAFLALRAWQLRRLDRAEVSSSTPLT